MSAWTSATRTPGKQPPKPWRERAGAAASVVSRHRRLLTALVVFVAVAAGLAAVAPGSGPTVDAVVTTRDVPLGARLSSGDVTVEPLPAAAVPNGALRSADEALGRLVTGPVRKGEVVTDVRLVAPHLSAALADLGLVAAPVRLTDPGVARVVGAGDRVDVLAATPSAAGGDVTGATSAPDPSPGLASGRVGDAAPRAARRSAETVAIDAVVVAVPPPETADATDGGLVVLAVTPGTAAALAQAAVVSRLTVSLRGD